MNEPTEKIVGEIWAFVVTDHLGNEGVLLFDSQLGRRPLIADSRERLDLFLDDAAQAALELKLKLGIARFVRDERIES